MNFYKTFIQKMMNGDEHLNPSGQTFKIDFLTSAYTVDLTDTGHDFHDDLTGIEESVTLTGVTLSNRVFDATGPTSVPDGGGGQTITQAVLWRDSGMASTSPLIAHDDIADYVQDGVAETLAFDASGILRIGGA